MPTDTPENAADEPLATPWKPRRLSKEEAEAKLRAIAEAQGVVLDGKAYERVLAAGADFFDSPEEHEQFIELLQKIRKTP
jgi:2-keto-3-deoxy-6-phosphogluconate aldolase